MKSFATFHPFVLFIYYVMIITITMFIIHPVILILSLIGSVLFFSMLTTGLNVLKDIGFYVLVLLLIAITNPLFVHKGETILFFLNDKPVTFEAIIYGFVIAAMLVAVIFWSKSYSVLMTTDKFLYLFGKMIPKLALVLSMAFRFIPLFKIQIIKVHAAQKSLGLYSSNSIADRIMSGIRVFNSILTWSLENSIIQADAMKAKGYGLPRRTNFSMFNIDKRDVTVLILLFSMIAIIFFAQLTDNFNFNFYPVISEFTFTAETILYFTIIFLLTVFPFIIEVKENLHWKLLKRKI